MGATHFLPRLVGYQVASYLLLTGNLVSASEAKDLGLVLEVVPEGQALVRAKVIATKIAQNSSHAVGLTTKTLRTYPDLELERAFEIEATAQAQSYQHHHLKEGLKAIAERRAPIFD